MNKKELLNITTLQHLAQLQAKVPNILTIQMGALFDRWPGYMLEVESALKTCDFELAAEVLHKLKGHSGMLGFIAVQALCDELEVNCIDNFRNKNSTPCDTDALRKCFEESYKKFSEILPTIHSLKPHGDS